MTGRQSRGRVSLTIDLELDLSQQRPQSFEGFLRLSSELPLLIAAHGLQATWGVADPARSAARDAIMAIDQGQELAVLGQRCWMGNGRNSLLARELLRRFSNARRGGLACSTLLVRNTSATIDLRPLWAAGVTSVRPPVCEQFQTAEELASPVREGVWIAPSPVSLHPQGTWKLTSYLNLAWQLRRAARERKLVSLAIDAAVIADQADRYLVQLDTLLSLVSRHVQAGNLECVTLAQIAREQLRARSSAPSRSILRTPTRKLAKRVA